MNTLDLRPSPDEEMWDAAMDAQERTEDLSLDGHLDEAEGPQRCLVAQLDAAIGRGHPDPASPFAKLAQRGSHPGRPHEASALPKEVPTRTVTRTQHRQH